MMCSTYSMRVGINAHPTDVVFTGRVGIYAHALTGPKSPLLVNNK